MTSPDVEAPWTVARLLAWTKDFLQRRGVESPRLCAELLLAHAMGCERLRLFTRYEETPAVATLDQFRAMVREAGTGRPIAYIVGRKDFFSLSFDVTPDVLIPRPETELLVERTLNWARDRTKVAACGSQAGDSVAACGSQAGVGGSRDAVPAAPPRILDLGCGSGCIAISLARNLPQARLFASDLSPAALEIAKRNSVKLGLADRVEFRLGDLFEPWSASDDALRFDAIVSNPPYLRPDDTVSVAASVREYEPHAALFGGGDGLAVVRRIGTQAQSHLSDAGVLMIEIGAGQAAVVRALLADAGWHDIQLFRDGGGIERVACAQAAAVGGEEKAVSTQRHEETEKTAKA